MHTLKLSYGLKAVIILDTENHANITLIYRSLERCCEFWFCLILFSGCYRDKYQSLLTNDTSVDEWVSGWQFILLPRQKRVMMRRRGLAAAVTQSRCHGDTARNGKKSIIGLYVRATRTSHLPTFNIVQSSRKARFPLPELTGRRHG